MTAVARRSVVLVAGLLLLALTGCAMVPESGPVRRTTVDQRTDVDDTGTFNAPGPGKGDSPSQIVNGFLTAMTGNPTATGTARRFLTKRAREQWDPSQDTVIYAATTVTSKDDSPPGADIGATVITRLSDANRLDQRGGWLGAAGSSYSRLRLHLVRVDGEWRIANPPQALLIPDYFLEQEYRPYDIYFLDPSGRMLVPDRIYVPRGEQTPSLLVRALLEGPGSTLAPVTRSAFPPQTQLDLSVPVSSDGVAEVPLSRQVLRLPPATLDQAAAQLAWTLRQVPGLTRIRITADDNPVPVRGLRDFSVQVGDRFSPSVASADTDLFGLGKRRLVRIGSSGVQTVSGPFGRPGFALRSVAVSLDGTQAAAVSATGSDVYVGPVNKPVNKNAGGRSGQPVRVYRGTDVLPAAYDVYGRAWLIDRTPAGARVVEVGNDRSQVVRVPGITGKRITAFLVSRDGGRMVAVVDGPGRADDLVTAILVRSAAGGLARAIPGPPITSLPSDFGAVVTIAWRTPDDLAVLGRPAPKVSDVATVSLDGSPGDPDAVIADSWPGPAVSLVGAPDATEPLFLLSSAGALFRLDGSGRWRPTRATTPLSSVGYVG